MELKKYKLGDIGKIVTGKTPSTSNPDNFGGMVPFLTPSDDLSSVYVQKTAKTLSAKGVDSLKKLSFTAFVRLHKLHWLGLRKGYTNFYFYCYEPTI